MVGLCAALIVCAPAYGEPITVETAVENAAQVDISTVVHPFSRKEVDVVVVWGFRLRSTILDLRADATRQAYRELIDNDACVHHICGFVVAPDGDKWRSSNVMVASEAMLKQAHVEMEHENSSLVVVYPAGVRRELPNLHFQPIAPWTPPKTQTSDNSRRRLTRY